MWKTECEKEEKKSLDKCKWKYKEIWLLDYVMRYGNNATKEKESKQKKRNCTQKR